MSRYAFAATSAVADSPRAAVVSLPDLDPAAAPAIAYPAAHVAAYAADGARS
ncbi:hypothetical protein [Streptomyces sp. ICBB 8177]|uniref:hypothetical protein n=1 Tax=Streptomyces sp. ICBB 8177 TaxID=563922 RepID=UPI0013050BFA|nr:hypothetical protein [Streptomyces sp. ICBB 8177]